MNTGLLKFFVGLLTVSFIFSSCGKENVDDTDIDEDDVTTETISCDSLQVELNWDEMATLIAVASGGNEPYAFMWSNEEATDEITVAEDGTYSVTVTDAEGCTRVASIEVEQQQEGCDSISLDLVYWESDGGIEAAATGGIAPYTYTWSDGTTGSWLAISESGSYSVVATDANGCVLTNEIEVAVTVTDPCADGMDLVLTYFESDGAIVADIAGGTAPYTYTWSNGSTTEWIDVNASGVYTLTVVDSEGCTSTQEIEVNIDLEPCLEEIVIYLEWYESDMVVGAEVEGGAPPYSFVWSDGSTGEWITAMAGGTYTVSVTDANGCFATEEIEVGVSDPCANLSLSIQSSNGTATANASGGTAPYTYQWTNGVEGNTLTVDEAGVYQLIVVDANGCSATEEVYIEVDGGQECTGILTLNANSDVTINVSTDAVAYLFTGDCVEGFFSYDHNYMIVGADYDFFGQEPNMYVVSDGFPGITLGSNGIPQSGDVLGHFAEGVFESLYLASENPWTSYVADNIVITIDEAGNQEGQYISGTVSGTIVAQNDSNDTATITGAFCVPIVSVCD